MAPVLVRSVRKTFGAAEVIHGVTIDVDDGDRHPGRPIGLRKVDASAHDRGARADFAG